MKKSLSKKIASYALTGAAVTVGGVSMAEADVVDSMTSPVTLEADMPGQSVDVDVDGDGVFDFILSVFDNSTGVSEAFVITGLGANLVGPDSGATTYQGNRNYLDVFNTSFAGTSAVGSAVLGVTYGANTITAFTNLGGITGQPGGLQFDIGGQTHFGAIFLDSQITGQGVGEMTFSFQWETDPDVAFSLAVVPEPTSLALLALGTVGLASRRRRR